MIGVETKEHKQETVRMSERSSSRRNWTQAGATLVLAALVAWPVFGQAKRPEEIRYPELPDFEIPEPTRVELDNGMVVILLEDHELPLVSLSALVRTGSRLEPADKVGLASLVGSVQRTGGTTSRSGDEIDEFLEDRAATIETSIGTTSGRASASALAEDLPEVLELFADILRNPVFDEDKLAVAKTQATGGISRQNDDPGGIVSREFAEVIYGADSPYVIPATYTTIDRITRRDLVDFHARYFHPNRVVLGAVGDFETEELLQAIRDVFGDWQRGGPESDPVADHNETAPTGVYYIPKEDVTQSNILMGHLGVLRDNPDYYAIQVLNDVFSGSFASRLFSNVRSKKALAYAVSGGVGSQWDYPGTFTMSMTTKTETTGAGIEALIEEARNLTAKPPTEAEIERSKRAILNSFIFNSDSKGEILGQQLAYEYYGYGLDWLERYRAGIEAVTVDEVRAAAEKYIDPDAMAIVVVGPSEGRDKPLETYGEVEVIDITIPELETEAVAATDEGLERGRELVDGVVQAMGGAERLDGIESYHATASTVASTPQGEMEITGSVLIVFPDRFRQEMSMPFGDLVMAIDGETGFMQMPQGTQVLPDSQRRQASQEVARNLLTVLRSRADDGFSAVYAGEDSHEGATLDLVTIESDGQSMTLGVDRESRLVVTKTYRGSGFGGAPGEMIDVYGDYREVEGILLPFSRTSSFEGKPATETQIESIELDGAVDDSLFERPAA